jgi:hypothetical protein
MRTSLHDIEPVIPAREALGTQAVAWCPNTIPSIRTALLEALEAVGAYIVA